MPGFWWLQFGGCSVILVVITVVLATDKEVSMKSPLREWIDEQGLLQGRFALIAGVDRTDVCRVSRGQGRMPRKLRQYLEQHAPEVLAAQDEWLESLVAA